MFQLRCDRRTDRLSDRDLKIVSLTVDQKENMANAMPMQASTTDQVEKRTLADWQHRYDRPAVAPYDSDDSDNTALRQSKGHYFLFGCCLKSGYLIDAVDDV